MDVDDRKVGMPDDELAPSVQKVEEPWYSDCDKKYTGCAMPIGQKAEFWRQYFYTNLHMRIEYRSDQDRILRDFAEVERKYLELSEDYNMRVTYCEFLCEQAPWGIRQLRRLTRKLSAFYRKCLVTL